MVTSLREIYQLKIQLNDIRPPIWRRLLISSTSSLEDFHHAIQIVMGWTNSHLHQFVCGSSRYGKIDPESDIDPGFTLHDEINFKVKDLLKKEDDSILYEYDFGDGWEHKMTLEKILPYKKDQTLPFCIKGKRACPPEDVGGVFGYFDFLEKWSNEDHPEHKDMREWAGDHFESESFSPSETNEILREVFTRT